MMRPTFDPIVEAGRRQDGRYASPPLARYGAFIFRHPKSGNLFKVLASDGAENMPWEHVSVSLVAGDRLPTWGEMCWVKSLFWGSEERVVQFHPPESEYVNIHEGVLHLWKPIGIELPHPPRRAV
jgi:hypothetical protein